MNKAIMKTISWRVIAVFITSVIVYLLTGSFALSIAVAIPETIVKLLAYYAHEKVWEKVK